MKESKVLMSALKLEREEETWSNKVIILICGLCGGENKTEVVNDFVIIFRNTSKSV